MTSNRYNDKRIGIFGGSFDPPHNAHIMLARQALEHSDGVDWIMMIPTFSHAFGKNLTPYKQRIAMLRLAFGKPWFPESLRKRLIISRIEQRLGGTSYTIETVKELRRLHPTAEFHLLVGGDAIQDLPLWYQADELLKMAPPIAFPRDGIPIVPIPCNQGKWVHGVELPAISSTSIRTLCATGVSTDLLESMMPTPVLDYIQRYKLYQNR